MMTLRQKIKILRRRYKFISRYRFFYNEKSDLKRIAGAVYFYMLVHSEQFGYGLMRLRVRRGQWRTPREWFAFFRDDWSQTALPKILDNIEGSSGQALSFVQLVGIAWVKIRDLQKSDNSEVPYPRRKTRASRK